MEKSREAKTTYIKRTVSIVFAACLLTVTRAGLPSEGRLEDHGTRFVAALPNGATVELIGVTFHSPGVGLSERKLWWRPDGSDLPNEPYRHPRKCTSAIPGCYAREFAMRITGTDNYGSATFNSSGRTNVQPVIPLNEKNESLPDLRAFACLFKDSQSEDTIRIGVSVEPWQTLKGWTRTDWHKVDPDGIQFEKSEHPFILSWPRQKGRYVILEMVHAYLEEAVRLVVVDNDGNAHEEAGSVHGEGAGMIKYQFTFWELNPEDISRIEVQKRSYQWVEFRNVSLRPGHKTELQVHILPDTKEVSRADASHAGNQGNLGYLLDRLESNTRFPKRGHAIYEVEESFGQADSPRVLKCESLFLGSRYRFEVETARQGGPELGTLNYRSFFDGEKTTRWYPLADKADIRQGRKVIPLYRLERYSAFEMVNKLLGHDVQMKEPNSVDGRPCLLLECVVSAKEKIRVWVTNNPDIYPLRIEAYEFDNLRYLYRAENVRYWETVLFPEKTIIEWYKSGDSGEVCRVSRKVVILKSFSPTIEIADEEFKPKFAHEGISVTEFKTTQPQAAAFAQTLVGRLLPGFTGINVEFSSAEAKGKMILLCFWDMNQRPSRHCVMELTKRAEELKEKGIAIVLVQASKVDKEQLDNWVKKNHISFPIGMVEGDAEEVRFNWGVKSLPWLILTDAEHIIRAEGFALNELDGRLKQLSGE